MPNIDTTWAGDVIGALIILCLWAVALSVALLWIVFPWFVYHYLSRIADTADRIASLLASKNNNTQEQGRRAA